MPYLEGNATKYVVRWKSKNGEEDLKKAKSYVSKILIRHRIQGPVQRACRYLHKLWVQWEYRFGGKTIDETFFRSNNVELWESRICIVLRTWQKESDLIVALDLIDFLLVHGRQ